MHLIVEDDPMRVFVGDITMSNSAVTDGTCPFSKIEKRKPPSTRRRGLSQSGALLLKLHASGNDPPTAPVIWKQMIRR